MHGMSAVSELSQYLQIISNIAYRISKLVFVDLVLGEIETHYTMPFIPILNYIEHSSLMHKCNISSLITK